MSHSNKEFVDAAASKDRQFVTALARGLEILQAFEQGEATLTNQDLAERTGLPKPTVSRLTGTLVELGYLAARPDIGGYALGPRVLALGFAVLAGLDIAQRARPVMQSLSEDMETTVMLVGRDGDAVVCLEVTRPSQAVLAVTTQVGARLPLHSTPHGFAMLAALPDSERDAALSAVRGVIDPAAFRQFEVELDGVLDQQRASGFFVCDGGWRDGVIALGAPLAGTRPGDAYALVAAAPSRPDLEARWRADYGPRFAQAAAAL